MSSLWICYHSSLKKTGSLPIFVAKSLSFLIIIYFYCISLKTLSPELLQACKKVWEWTLLTMSHFRQKMFKQTPEDGGRAGGGSCTQNAELQLSDARICRLWQVVDHTAVNSSVWDPGGVQEDVCAERKTCRIPGNTKVSVFQKRSD